jgi:hypothetical protein
MTGVARSNEEVPRNMDFQQKYLQKEKRSTKKVNVYNGQTG